MAAKKLSSNIGQWEVVIFYLGSDVFAINVNKTREILQWQGCRPVPTRSHAFAGITNVRDMILPLVDLRVFLGIDSPVPLEKTKVMIVEFNDIRMGFIVDFVERIQQVNADDLDTSNMSGISAKWVLYVIKNDKRNILLLDYEAIIQDTTPEVSNHMFDMSRLLSYHEMVGNVDNFHILLADDSPLLRQQVCDALQQTGFYSVYPVKDGEEARALLLDKGEEFHLLISDVEMPVLDGISLVEELRKDNRTKNMPVILFSSIMVKDILDRAQQLGVTHVLKPDIYGLVENVMLAYQKEKEKGEREERERELASVIAWQRSKYGLSPRG